MPQICLWSLIGNTQVGGHYWNLDYSPLQDKFYTIDAAMLPDTTEIENRPEFALNFVYIEIWYMFNEDRAYTPLYGVDLNGSGQTESTKT